MSHLTIRGRGAAHDPPNRFVPIYVEPATDHGDGEASARETTFFRDATRSVITRNDSPDVGFSASLNPYRGCETGCCYCLRGETPILMGNGTLRNLADLRPGDEIYGTVREGWYRKYVRTLVLAHWEVQKEAFRVTLEDGTELVASGDHRFLTWRGWKFVTNTRRGARDRPHLTENDKLLGIGALRGGMAESPDYRRGYLCGMIRGDGLLRDYEYRRATGGISRTRSFRLALVDDAGLSRTAAYLAEAGVETRQFVFQRPTPSRREMRAIGAFSRERVERIAELVAWPGSSSMEWCRGFLAGIFDAEGSYSSAALRIANSDSAILHETTRALVRWGFAFAVEHSARLTARPLTYTRVTGGLRDHLRFFHTTEPAILRKRNIAGQAVMNRAPLRVVSVEHLGRRTLFDITTGTGDFIANGVVSHNCYARPTHEFLGLSAGFDFETKIFVKEDAPELLRRELAAPGWKPQVLALSGVTDAYQPVERKLRVTRRCVEVLAEFRNPVAVITKHHLVTRDIDLLRELARHGAAAVTLSITTLRRELQRVLEPRAATPERRLEAVRKLAEAGIPTGVLVAPVIPGLTDFEMPHILKAAAEAGASRAGYVLLRLPHGLKELFEDWLERHVPDRKGKVLNRLRALHGGALYDARFGVRARGEGPYADQLRAMFDVTCRAAGLNALSLELSAAAFRRPRSIEQGDLFEREA